MRPSTPARCGGGRALPRWLVAVAVVVASVSPAVVDAARADALTPPAVTPAGRLGVDGTRLTADGRPVQLVGINAPMAATSELGYGCGAAVAPDDVFGTVPAGSLVRVLFSRSMATDQATGLRDWRAFDRLVAAAEASPRRPRLVVTLTSQSGACDDGLWKDQAWYDAGYRTIVGGPGTGGGTFLDFLRAVVDRYGASPAVAMWEAVGEPEAANCPPGVSGGDCYAVATCPPGADASLRAFLDATGAEIHALAPATLVSSGALGGAQCGWAQVPSLPNASPEVDVLSYHDYGSDAVAVTEELARRLDEAQALDKPLIVAELGMHGRDVPGCRGTAARAALLEAKILGQLAAGAAGVVLWLYGDERADACDHSLQADDPVLQWLSRAGGTRTGYWVVTASGTVTPFGDALRHGSTAPGPGAQLVDIAATPSGFGYWLLMSDGRVEPHGDAPGLGDAVGLPAGERAASLAPMPSGGGYLVVTEHGRVLAFGDARAHGDLTGTRLNARILDAAMTASGQGYHLVAADGGVFCFGDATFHGSTGAMALNAPIAGLVADPDGTGYWLVARDGGVFAFAAGFLGSMGGVPLNLPVTGMIPYGDGYLMVAEDGGVFTFSNRPFRGSLGGRPGDDVVVALAALP
jgi:mannan endo-1,4-beta-mannosidase